MKLLRHDGELSVPSPSAHSVSAPERGGGGDRGRITLCVLEVVSPQWSDLVLTADVPHRKADVLVLDCLHIETYTTEGKEGSLKGEAQAYKLQHM